MATFVVLSPAITWTGTPVADSKITWQSATINVQAGTGTYLTTGGVSRKVPDLKQWSGTITGHLGTPNTGVALNVSMTGGYDTNVDSWGFQFNVAPESYYTNASSNGWMEFLPGVESWTASYTAKLDDAEPLVAPGASAAELVLTSSSGNTITGDAIVTAVNPNIQIGGIPAVSVSLEGDNTVAIAGSNNIATAVDPLTRIAASSLVIKAHEVGTTDVQYSGSAFITQLSINAATSGLITYAINFQGTGALTIADPAA